ncbi:MAG TPA: hypothetical protein VG097_20040 [Gemmata sp.]|jgi:hypothetical protein|nr:hypothetical protein [Gemmata sp.]
MRSCLAIAVILFLCTSPSAQEVKTYESKAGKYKADFPKAPNVDTKKVDDGVLNIASIEYKGGGFIVIYSDLDAEKLKKSKPKEILAGGEKGLIEGFKPKITSTKDIEFGKQKYPARQIAGEAFLAEEGININLRLTLILADNRLYQVFVFGPKDLPNGKEAEKFFETFEITK